MQANPDLGPPTKRRRLSNDSPDTSANFDPQQPLATMELVNSSAATNGDERDKEQKRGITGFAHPDLSGFSGVLKQRYTDFLVNEILPDGRVLHLESTKPPKAAKPAPVAARSEHQPQADRGNEYQAAGVAQPSRAVDENRDLKSDKPTEPAAALDGLLSEDTIAKISTLYAEILQDPSRKGDDRAVQTEAISDRALRTQLHKTIREVFASKLDSTTGDDDTITITPASSAAARNRSGWGAQQAPRNKARPGWQELGGEHLHFTLYKENKDTMEAAAFIASQLKVPTKTLQFSGTKDRRAVTVQRCSAYRVKADQLAALNRRLRGSRVGDFEYQRNGLELGELGGNEFVISLRDCHFPGEEGFGLEDRLALAKEVVSQSVDSFRSSGFINYYGLQRFGSFANSTDSIGVKLLQGDIAGAIADILSFSPESLTAALDQKSSATISNDDKLRAKAIDIWNTTKNAEKALAKLPRKFSAESNIINHLGRRTKGPRQDSNLTDYHGALGSIPRNLRLMYVHAYQSLVWNNIASTRWELYGDNVIEGDLVLISEHADKEEKGREKAVPVIDKEGEPIVQASHEDRSAKAEDYERARPLSAEEAESGNYSVFDVVLPLPGFDVEYPANLIGKEYETFMAGEQGGGIDPHNMRRPQKDLSLSGGYRKLLARPGEDTSFEVKTYEKDVEQLVQTDLEVLMSKTGGGAAGQTDAGSTENHPGVNGAVNASGTEAKVNEEGEKKIAVVLRMQLGSSTYATMALRELMKQGGVKTYKPDFGGGR